MSPSVHLLFLLSLAVFSWAILCYFKEIERRLMCSPADKIQEDPIIGSDDEQKLLCDYRSPRFRNNYELYVNFLCIFACIYVLAKVVHIAERYLARQMYGKFNVYKDLSLRHPMSRTASSECDEDVEEMLRLQIEELTKQNQNLKIELSRYDYENSDRFIGRTQSSCDGLLQNIYITNRNVRLNNSVYLSGDVVSRQLKIGPEKTTAFNKVWENYLVMQKESQLKSPSFWATDHRESPSVLPLVLSTEDLQKFHGLA